MLPVLGELLVAMPTDCSPGQESLHERSVRSFLAFLHPKVGQELKGSFYRGSFRRGVAVPIGVPGGGV